MTLEATQPDQAQHTARSRLPHRASDAVVSRRKVIAVVAASVGNRLRRAPVRTGATQARIAGTTRSARQGRVSQAGKFVRWTSSSSAISLTRVCRFVSRIVPAWSLRVSYYYAGAFSL